MEIPLYLAAAGGSALGAVIAVLLIKLYLIKKSVREIRLSMEESLTQETNTLIGIYGGDRSIRLLAEDLNRQLRLLREERARFRQGDQELKRAIANSSHDLRTPLTAVFGYLDLLEKEEKSRKAEEYLAVIRDRSEAMKQLTEDLFTYSLAASSSREPEYAEINLKGALEESIASFYPAFKGRGIEPAVSITEKRVERRLDAVALERILENILSNALKYSGGDLRIALEPSGEMRFSNSAPDLDEVRTERLFDRFYTVETAGRSTGLGLSIARILTEKMGGNIKASFKEGRLTITLYFPEGRPASGDV